MPKALVHASDASISLSMRTLPLLTSKLSSQPTSTPASLKKPIPTMLPSTRTNTVISSLRHISAFPSPRRTSPTSPLRPSLLICTACFARGFKTTPSRRALQPRLSAFSIQRAWTWSTGLLLGKLKKRPTAVEQATVPEMVRGMKVRSSVKKLCDGCKVRGAFLGLGGKL